jgi:predicted RNA-binding Zn-ribbon protein involved in translation (DUF1610 family)
MSSIDILNSMRQTELYRMGILPPDPPADIQSMKELDQLQAKVKIRNEKSNRKRSEQRSKVLCPKCFNHVRIIRNYSHTNILYDCIICGFSWTKHEVFGTMANDI